MTSSTTPLPLLNDRRLTSLLDAGGDGFWELDAQRRYVFVSDSLCRLLACEAEALIGRSVLERLAPEYAEELMRLAKRRAESADPEIHHGPQRHEGEVIGFDGTRRWFESISVPVLDDAGTIVGYFGLTRDMTERRRGERALADTVAILKAQVAHNQVLQDQLRDLASRDALTGLHNRRHFLETADRELARAERHGSGLALVMVDVDHFKRINDGHGHACGDEALRQVAELLRATARAEDLPCRIGGEEFAVLLPGMDLPTALGRAEAWRATLAAQPLKAEGVLLPVTASFGVAVFPQHGATVSALMRSADRALYAAKGEGRNRVGVAIDG